MRTPRTAACVAFALSAVLAGCGTKTTLQNGSSPFSATTLTVYSSLPLEGPDLAQQTSIYYGEELALYRAGGHVNEFHVSFTSADDADPLTAAWNAQATAEAARAAAQDHRTVAYIGDFDSAATAVSLPLNNENEVLQISPGSPYAGFTDRSPANLPGDPGNYSPFGTSTFARLVPSDLAEARATVRYMRALGVRRLAVVADRADPRNAAIAPLVAAAAPAAGIAVVARRSVDSGALQRPGRAARTARALAGARPDAILFGGVPGAGARALWGALHAAAPAARLFAPSTLAVPAFLTGLGGAADSTYVTSPYLEPDQYPADAQRVFREYRARFGVAPTVLSLYGYEAMRLVLAAIRRAGHRAGDRQPLLDAFFAPGERHGVIGTYRINRRGDISPARFDGYRVGAGGRLVLVRPLG